MGSGETHCSGPPCSTTPASAAAWQRQWQVELEAHTKHGDGSELARATAFLPPQIAEEMRTAAFTFGVY